MIPRCQVAASLAAIGVALWLANAGSTAADPPGKCTLARIAEWPVRPMPGGPVVDGMINGQKVGILIDTGATKTMVLRSAARRLGLIRHGDQGSQALGIGGETAVESVLIDELKIGDAVRKSWRMLVTGESDFGDVAMLLGEDFFQLVDVEFDLAHDAVRLFQAKDCAGRSLAYWSTGDADEVALEPVSAIQPRIELTVAVNGRAVSAMLDSGAGLSVLTLAQAAAVGVTPETPGVAAAGCGRGLGRKPIEVWIGPFTTFAVGHELVRDPRIRFADLWRYSSYKGVGIVSDRPTGGLPDMLLGADFLRSHRVLIAHSQRKMYFTYAGGTVFPNWAPKACDDLPRHEGDTKPPSATN